MNEQTLDEKIRRRAYELWEKDSSPAGPSEHYWEAARREIEAEDDGAPGGPAPSGDGNRKSHAEIPDDRDVASATDLPAVNRSDTVQSAQDARERRKHAASENALESSQNSNPIPPGSTRK
ncbi:DUF2934 domain-containing protein [Paraburkholderia sp. BL9I2N2]|uniref:DUF2934 domain-containing protein n=1 Tax=Paraburkholderia sp. BL9I2N2 TaxID=1938809 RepID=UPI001051FD61|nr:DUF2934 domain-containing protein [Paraburkholderia sp. BL9I2N2]TCK84180.1 DUF2934 family protein [Paraburkholderia sp. BL9I2N2]